MRFFRVFHISLVLFFGVVILAISVARAGLEIMAIEGNDEVLRNDPIKFVIVNEDGEKNEFFYKLPEPGSGPTSPFYGFKKIRDYLWIKLTPGGVRRAKVELLVADKRMAEAKAALEDNRGRSGLDASQAAFETLKLAERSISGIREETDESKQISSQIFKAGFAYMTILKNSKGSFEMDVKEYDQLVNELDEWNKEQKSKQEENSE